MVYLEWYEEQIFELQQLTATNVPLIDLMYYCEYKFVLICTVAYFLKRADYMGELSRLSEWTRFAELTRFLLLFPIISTLRLHGKRVVPLRRDPG